MAEEKWRTLPLFETATGSPQGIRSVSRRKEQSPLNLVLHIYWSAGLEAHALGAMAARAPYPDQQRALWELQKLEEERKELAARSLEAIWQVRLPAFPTSAESPVDLNGRAA